MIWECHNLICNRPFSPLITAFHPCCHCRLDPQDRKRGRATSCHRPCYHLCHHLCHCHSQDKHCEREWRDCAGKGKKKWEGEERERAGVKEKGEKVGRLTCRIHYQIGECIGEAVEVKGKFDYLIFWQTDHMGVFRS